jgi:hypothetical protein
MKQTPNIWPAVIVGGILIAIPDPVPFAGPTSAAGILVILSAFGIKYLPK